MTINNTTSSIYPEPNKLFFLLINKLGKEKGGFPLYFDALFSATFQYSQFVEWNCEEKKYVLKENPNIDVSLLTITDNEKPIDIVCEKGYYKVLEHLLKKKLKDLGASVETLCSVLKKSSSKTTNEINFKKCSEILLDKMKFEKIVIDVNEQDRLKNTPLHYSLRYCDAATTETLLQFGASLASKNKFEFMPIQYADSKILEKPLDDCIKCEGNIGKEKVNFNYQILLPPKRKKLETENNTPDSDTGTENQSINGKSTALNNNSLLKNQIENFLHETEVIRYMSTSPDLRSLLRHPVIVSFLFIKWHQIRCIFYVNLVFYMSFLLSLITYIFTYYGNFDSDTSKDWYVSLSWVILNLLFWGLMLRELFQIVVLQKKYIQNFENYIEIVLILITGLILYIPSPSNNTKKQLASIVILLAAFELVLMIGKHPKLSTYVVMLKIVSAKFFILLLWSSLLVIAFAWSFSILFRKTENPQNLNETSTYDYFKKFEDSLFKTIIMLTGEFDTGSINFENYPILSKTIFLIFVFMIAIVLLNLLNGLAVNDIQTIKNDSELVVHILRAEYIYDVESTLLGLGNYKLTDLLLRLNCIKVLVKKVFYFQFAHDSKLIDILDEQENIKIEKNDSFWCCRLNHFDTYLDKATVRRIKNIVKTRREKNIIQQMNVIEEKLNKILEIKFQNSS